MPDTYTLGRIELRPSEPRHLTQAEQRMMDGALRKATVKPIYEGYVPEKANNISVPYGGSSARKGASSPTPWHDPEDEFYGGIWWVPEGKGMRDASPGECAREIQRLRTQLRGIGEALDQVLRGNYAGWDRTLARIRDRIKGENS